tara:strand:+ start:1370 stop:1789 length:420 start_codon:yes stop_codon:yes gene_type:complete
MPYKDLEKRKQYAKESNARYYLTTLKLKRQTPEGKIKHSETVKRFYQKHPEKAIENKNRIFSKLGDETNMTLSQVKWYLLSWSKSVRKRDNNICQNCGEIAVNSHHIIHKKNYSQLMLNINNGISLCKKCHNECHLWGN